MENVSMLALIRYEYEDGGTWQRPEYDLREAEQELRTVIAESGLSEA